MDSNDDSTPPSSPGLAYDPFDVSDLHAQLPAQQQQQSYGPTTTPPTALATPYEEGCVAIAKPRTRWVVAPTPEEDVRLARYAPDNGEVLPPEEAHPRPPQPEQLLSQLLKRRFRQNYGVAWEHYYVLPAIRRALLLELRTVLATDPAQAFAEEDEPDDRRAHSCYLHRFYKRKEALFPVHSRRGQ